MPVSNFVKNSFEKLEVYCRFEEFKGWDPFDGLNSRAFQRLPLVKNKSLARLIWIQALKRNPLNLRGALLVDKEYNPKGVALFLSGYCNLYRRSENSELLEIIRFLAEKLIELRSTGFSRSCWGYNFDWQARAFFQPGYTPTVVATTYSAYALMDAYEITGEARFLEVALDAEGFVLKDLNRTHDAAGDFAFSYSPLDKTQVFNASLLGSRLLSRIYFYTKDARLLEAAGKSVAFCAKNQHSDGSWSYGTLPFHGWVDNFHTGYNLECLAAYKQFSGDTAFDETIEKGFSYYINTFFTEDGVPKYYSDRTFPVDVHNTAQLIITLSRLNRFERHRALADKVIKWTVENMQDEKGYFYYQQTRYFTNRIPYMRWTQAWMFYALSEYLSRFD